MMIALLLPLLSSMPDSAKILPSLLAMANVQVSLDKFHPKESPLPGVKKLILDQRGLSIELTIYEQAKTALIDIERAPTRVLSKIATTTLIADAKAKVKKYSGNLGVFNGKFAVAESVTQSNGKVIVVREEKPLGFWTSERGNRVCLIQDVKTGEVQSVTLQFDRKYLVPANAVSLKDARKRFPNLRKVTGFVGDVLLWVPEDYVKPKGSMTDMVLCYDIVTRPMVQGEFTSVHTYYDPTSGKKIGQIDPRVYRGRGR